MCHADDIVMYGEDVQQHNQRLHQVLNRLREEGLKLNEKCEFAKENIMFLGHRVTADSVTPDPGKVKVIMESLNQPELKE